MKYNRLENPAIKNMAIIKRKIKHREVPIKSFDEFLTRTLRVSQKMDDLTQLEGIMMFLLGKENDPGIHYFVSKEMWEFLTETPIKEVDSFTQISNIIDGGLSNPFPEAFGFNFKNGYIHGVSSEPAISFLVSEINGTKEITVSASQGEYTSTCGTSFNPTFIETWENEPKRRIRAVMNLFMYMSAFPDLVMTGAPEINCEGVSGKAKKAIIKTAECLIDRSGVTPHFRRGYFKFLNSDFYKKKRGQVVFVHSTFVKGKAVTVMDDGITELTEAK